MIPYKYTYFVFCLLFFIPWLLLYFHRKDLRKEMLFMSILLAFGSLITGYLFWTIDWWRPETITATRVGFEDFILGFANGGIAAVIYEEIYRTHFIKRKAAKKNYYPYVIIFSFIFFISFLFWGFNINSFTASSVSMIITTLLIFFLRKDLIIDSIISGLLMMIISIPIYLILIKVSPGWVEHTWLFNSISGIKFLGIPIEDLIFYLLFGFVTGPFYEIWQGYRLKKSR